MYDAYINIIEFMEQGGDVLWLIAGLTFLMWTLIFERFWYFQSEHKNLVRESTEKWESRPERRSWSAHQIREALISEASDKIAGTLPLIQTCVALCPLLGLLGTVTGMIASLSGVVGSTILKRKIDFETELFQDHLTMDH